MVSWIMSHKHLQCQSRQLMHCDTLKQDNDSTVRGMGEVGSAMHCDTLKQDNDSTVRGDGGGRVGEV